MARTQDYLKPRNKELQQLCLNLPQALRITTPGGEILWQNRAAEALEGEPEWESQPTTWQGKKALLLLPVSDQVPSSRLVELEEENTRLKRHQRQTARRKRKAEKSAQRREKAVEDLEKLEDRLKSKLDEANKQVAELQKKLGQEPKSKKAANKAAATDKTEVKKLEKELDGLKKQLEKKSQLESDLKEARKQETRLEQRTKELEKQNKELQEWALLLEQDKQEQAVEPVAEELKALQAQVEEKTSALELADKRYHELQDDFDEFRHRSEENELRLSERLRSSSSSEDLEKSQEELQSLQTQLERSEELRDTAEARVRELETESSDSEKRLQELQLEFDQFRREAEEADAQRQLEEKVKEFEELERALEQEQSAFAEQKAELERKLSEQESDFQRLKGEISGESQPAFSADDLDELKEELEDARTDLMLAKRKEDRLSEKLEAVQKLKDEQGTLLEEVQADLKQAGQREKELKETIELYSELKEELDHSRQAVKDLRGDLKALRERERELEEELQAKAAELKKAEERKAQEQPSLRLKTEVASPGLSKTLQQQLDFAQNRLRETEQKLDKTREELKQEKVQNQSSKEAEKLAFQDTLTGLPNRHMVNRYLDYSHKQANQLDRAVALFLIDIDGFRVLNETFGQEWGDQLLKAVGERLAGMRGGTHIFARHSQDRFILLAANLEKAGAAKFVEEASRSILDALAYPFDVLGESITLTGTSGASLGPTPGDELMLIMKNAERALQSAKAKGVGSFHLFDESLRQVVQRDVAYKRQMEHALSKDEFQAVYQPVLDLNRGGVTGVELLLRWHHRDQRVLKPSDFLEAAVDSGMIFPITAELWPRAFRALAKWRKQRKGLTLSLNLSDRELLSSTLLDRVEGWLKKVELDPSAVIFEVRDSSRLRISSSWWPTLEKIRSRGFGLCLDDYGSEASLFGTLAYVGFTQAKLTVDEKKGASLVRPPSAAKGILYCAKGVQSKLDSKGLKKAGFDQVQGYAVGPPLDEASMDEALS